MKTLQFLLCAFFLLTSHFVVAGSATWKADPLGADWNVTANWSPATVPNGPGEYATFDFSNFTNVTQSSAIEVADIVFNSRASAFSISTANKLTFSGAGVGNNSEIEQNFFCLIDSGEIHFRNSATAGGSTTFTLRGTGFRNTKLVFHDTANAGSATVFNQSGSGAGGTWFYDSSTAAYATFINQGGGDNGGATLFSDSSTAGNATLICESGSVQGFVDFSGRSSAGGATIILDGASLAGGSAGELNFLGFSTASKATLTANGGSVSQGMGGQIAFQGNTTTAENATLIANPGTSGGLGGSILFEDGSLGGSARVEVFENGNLDISFHNSPGVTIGSLEGDGAVFLGTLNLTVGSSNTKTVFSGVIQDGGLSGGAGGSLTKIGSGNLNLSGANTYSGGTTLNGGTLLVTNTSGSGLGTGPVQALSGILGGTGIISGRVTMGTGRGSGVTLGPGANSVIPGTLTIGKQLAFKSDATYLVTVKSSTPVADQVIANGIRIIGAQIIYNEVSSATLPSGTVLTVIGNTSSKPISGIFANLPDGGTVTIGNNTFQANYEGGDGNDLTLTVVQ